MTATLDFTLAPRQIIYGDSGTHYRVVERLGTGGNSDVYLCQCNQGSHKGLLFAVKLMTNVRRPDRLERFKQELAFLKEVDHPGIMKVYDSGTHAIGPTADRVEVPFYVAEYLPRTLRDAMREGIFMVEKVAIAVQLVSALNFLAAPERAIVHRDIKPENIFIRGRSAILGDFGLLKALEPSELSERFCISELSRGPRHPFMYPTPELISYAKGDNDALTTKSDVFQLGLVLAELFCGTHPMKARAKTLDPIELDELKPFKASNASTIVQLISTMLTLDPGNRSTAEYLCDAWDGPFQEVINDAQRIEGRAFW